MSEDLSPLFRERSDPEPRPHFACQSIEDAVVAIATITKAPDLIAMQSVLTALSVAAQAHINVETLGGVAPASLFLLTIARSGERKTTCDKLAFRAINALEADRLRVYRRELKAFEDGQLAIRRREPEVIESDVDTIEAPTQEPMNPTISFGDVTLEAIMRHFANGNPSILIKSDEGGQFFGGHSMRRENRLKTASNLSRLWGGESIDSHRAGSGSNTFSGRRTSLHMMVQPQVANDVLSDETLVDQGLLARVLVAWPESMIGYRTIDNPDTYRREVEEANIKLGGFETRIRALMEREPVVSRDDPMELQPRLLKLPRPAYQALVDFFNRTEVGQRTGGYFEHVDGFASKIAENACRIAGILTLFEDPDASEVSMDAMINAIELAEWYIQEMTRLRECGIVSPELRSAERLRVWLRKERADEIVTTRDITRNGPRPYFNAETAKQLMDILETHGCVSKMPKDTIVDGRKTKLSWRVL